ncbi:hypothetical protein [Ammoniphilus resinae]|uniref:Uncharacterized protein n=1 Tax=Ammoniphilus resinae TaxID=861532 RepID=A0ABS4GJT3_9BACL|nr:hypothetical protein [Ammoniphilus resinae]MBP1930527.1 hypothetical protein [Ammoniphilus resinae]
MDFLFDLIFGNFWILILLFWLFRSLGRGKGEGQPNRREQRQRKYQYPPLTPTTMSEGWEMESPPVRQVKKTSRPIMVEEVAQEPVEEKVHHSRREKVVSQPTAHQTPVSQPIPSPVEGMMWSQVFGPPRSKLPHHTERKNRR